MFSQFKSILHLLEAFPDEQSCIDHLTSLRWNGKVISPFCPDSRVYKCKNNRYRCKKTGKYFNVRTGTIFGDTKLPLRKWFMALYIFSSHKKGISSHQLARDLDVTQKTAWFVLHRLRYAFDHNAFKEKMGGGEEIVQADETFVGGKESNKHQSRLTKAKKAELRRKLEKQGIKIMRNMGRSVDKKTAVLGIVSAGQVIAWVAKDTKTATLKKFLEANVIKGSVITTDEYQGYRLAAQAFNHETVSHIQGEFRRGAFHTNSIEGFWSQMKRGIYGIYHHVSREHLQAYVTEFTYRYNTRKYSTQPRFDTVLANTPGKRLTYTQLISHER